MTRIGILSDTHSFLNPLVKNAFAGCDEVWHAGDIGNLDVTRELSEFKPLRAVYGNIDDAKARLVFPEVLNFSIESTKVMMLHIAGYPGHYQRGALSLIRQYKPDLLVCGHSHILRIIYDKLHELLYINPGAAGNSGFHRKITCVRFSIDKGKFSEMEIIEFDRAGLSQPVG